MNKNLWSLYKHSDEGKKMIDLFDIWTEGFTDKIKEILDYKEKLSGIKEPDIYRMTRWFRHHFVNLEGSEGLPEDGVWTREIFENFITNYYVQAYHLDDSEELVFDDEVWLMPDDFRKKAATIDTLSLVLYEYCESFKPVLMSWRFDLLQKYCDFLGIEMPPIPRSRSYKDYLLYYYDICEAWNCFQKENEMTEAEFCAYLYGFGKFCVEEEKECELPAPTNVWLTGGAPEDFSYLDKLGKTDSHNHIWACNERTRRGDIVVMYCRSPRSYIHSIWQANSGGIFNPFDLYHCRATICNGRFTPHITINDLREDRYFRNVPIVRKNLQGINGWELTANDYKELIRLINEKGENPHKYPKLFDGGDVDFGEVKLEKDVEEQILIPMLEKLGYTEADWQRQLSQKAGRGLKAIPDFVFFPTGERHFASAPMVIEAKFDMSSIAERQNAFSQVLSYARMLRSKLMGLCDRERLIIYRVDENGCADRNNPIFENHWKAIYSDDVVGAELKKLIGREVVVKFL